MARTVQPLSAEREARLFEAAALAFTTQGFEAASLNRILETAGMRKSSFYHYFESKQDLHDRMIETLSEAIAEYVRPPDLGTLEAGSFWPAMRAMLADLSRMADERPSTIVVAGVFHASAPGGPDEASDRLREAGRSWTNAALGRGVELGVVRSDLPTALLGEIALAVFLALDRWALGPGSEASVTTDDAERALEALREMLQGS